MAKSLPALTQDDVRSTFDYVPETGRLVRIRQGLGARVGREIGSIDPKHGHRRAHFKGGNRMTAHMVWVWHNGSMPSGILRHVNKINSDDRIENLVILKKQLPVSYEHRGETVNQYGRLPSGIKTGVYEIFCTANGRRYVGSSVNFERRWRLHYTQLSEGKHHSQHLQRAWTKYGEDAFVFRVLEKCVMGDLIAREQHYIDTLGPEFNSRPRAGSQLGFKHSDESRRRMSASRPRGFSPMSGREHTAETKARISRAKTGRKYGSYEPSRVRKTAEAMRRGKGAMSEETAREIKRLKSLGIKHADVAKATGVSYSAVADIARGRCFAWVA